MEQLQLFFIGIIFILFFFLFILIKNRKAFNKFTKLVLGIIITILLALVLRISFFLIFERLEPMSRIDEKAISAMNKKISIEFTNKIFEEYCGENRTYSDANQLIQTIEEYNSQKEIGEKIEIIKLVTDDRKLNHNNSYSIKITEYYENGYIKSIEIKEIEKGEN